MAEDRYNKTFFSTFFTDRKQVGAVAPSSRFLVKSMCDKIDFANAKVILELGPGTGVFTTELLKRARQDCRIILFELNETFLDILNSKFDDDRLTVLHRSADEIDQVIEEFNITEVDAVLSSLPLTIIPKDIKHRIILNAYQALKENGVYVQYQYSLNAKKLLEKKFGKVKVGFVPINIPPAFVYSVRKLNNV